MVTEYIVASAPRLFRGSQDLCNSKFRGNDHQAGSYWLIKISACLRRRCAAPSSEHLSGPEQAEGAPLLRAGCREGAIGAAHFTFGRCNDSVDS
jgi:hypothetical protein